ncbi:polysaccharide biosynthesis/export family protein [Sphingomonas sp. SUN039]|uniref:polysaccharide biosynthesis/export family protein n=1 Tax=Sphingomonas sp. SUN039 TaxID=2937787 RepID=UPI0021640E23|nr:polysaccharide biosynthesis/export family protein [Sphingomonas sp. SUN039]UVO52755.1 polysaccharide biosynthesis/export family protein [Sphingomonas sp. SUN039]
MPAPAANGLPSGARLAPGDRLRIELLGDADRVTGNYVIAADGQVTLPGLGPVAVVGLAPEAAQHRLSDALLAAGQVRALRNAVALRLVEATAIKLPVAGAVFASGIVAVGERSEVQRMGLRDANGDMNGGRTLTAALRAAGGVRPDADLRRIHLERGTMVYTIDVSGALDGAPVDDVELAAGDRITVPSRGCFDAALVRPSSVTLGGVRIYMSNLSRPANNNAGGAVDAQSTSLPYGTRLLQGLASMNCVGGSAMNAGRRAVLISRNPLNGQSIVVERRVEELVRSADRDALDPYLMPNDAIACYDSRWMNFADAVGFVGSTAGAITPAIVLSRAAR